MEKKTLRTVMHPVFGLMDGGCQIDPSAPFEPQLRDMVLEARHNKARDAAAAHELLALVRDMDEFIHQLHRGMSKIKVLSQVREAAGLDFQKCNLLSDRVTEWIGEVPTVG